MLKKKSFNLILWSHEDLQFMVRSLHIQTMDVESQFKLKRHLTQSLQQDLVVRNEGRSKHDFLDFEKLLEHGEKNGAWEVLVQINDIVWDKITMYQKEIDIEYDPDLYDNPEPDLVEKVTQYEAFYSYISSLLVPYFSTF